MKYMVTLLREDDRFLNDPDKEGIRAAVAGWYGELAQEQKLQGGAELQPATTATTVRWEQDKPLITDGPFMEAKETIAGFALIDAADLDEAIALAERFPVHDHTLEIRPLVEHG